MIVKFEEKLEQFCKTLEKSINLHIDFWKELIDENPDILKLQLLGTKIT